MTHQQSPGRQPPEHRHDHSAALQDGLDFVNTLWNTKPAPREDLPDLPSAVRWFDEYDLLHREMVREQLERHSHDDASSQPVLRRVQRVRAALRELLDATVEHRPAEPAALREVNRALRTHYIYELVPAPDGVTMDHRHEGDPIDGALARLAESVARELTKPDAARLRICDNPDCRWVFYDSSPSGRRRWCDMSTCGNRAKVARHRARQREREEQDGQQSG
ncbi:MAG TPA: CGNR zinc finger domain-containing protein [Candidatus Limnocylindria bacterium]|nr:CGNR zinc finger domain-containing protein [Candidatus Limnocylindria bacterium]